MGLRLNGQTPEYTVLSINHLAPSTLDTVLQMLPRVEGEGIDVLAGHNYVCPSDSADAGPVELLQPVLP